MLPVCSMVLLYLGWVIDYNFAKNVMYSCLTSSIVCHLYCLSNDTLHRNLYYSMNGSLTLSFYLKTLAYLILATIIDPFYSAVFIVIMVNLSLEFAVFFGNPDLV